MKKVYLRNVVWEADNSAEIQGEPASIPELSVLDITRVYYPDTKREQIERKLAGLYKGVRIVDFDVSEEEYRLEHREPSILIKKCFKCKGWYDADKCIREMVVSVGGRGMWRKRCPHCKEIL